MSFLLRNRKKKGIANAVSMQFRRKNQSEVIVNVAPLSVSESMLI
jgi:hypothetical protein